MSPSGNKCKPIEECKQYLDQKITFLIYKVDENKQIVFRSLVVKMDIAAKMSLSTHFFWGRIFVISMEKLIEQGASEL